MGSDGFEKVLIGTRGARETLLQGRKGRAAKNSVLTSGENSLNASGAKLTRVCVPRTVNGGCLALFERPWHFKSIMLFDVSVAWACYMPWDVAL